MLWKMTPRRWVGYLRCNCYVHPYRFPGQTRAGILDAQSGSNAYLSVQNHKFLRQKYRVTWFQERSEPRVAWFRERSSFLG